MKLIVICVLLASIFGLSECYRILGLFPLPVKSHMIMFEKLMEGLAKKGHQVDVLSRFPRQTPLPRYNDISLLPNLPVLANNISIPFARNKLGSYIETIKSIVIKRGREETCRDVLSTTVAQELKNTRKRYDLVITEIFGSDCMLGFAHRFNVPIISITSSVSLPWGGDRIGNPDNPSYIPNYFVAFSSRMSLRERMINTVLLIEAKFRYMISEGIATAIAQDFFGPNLPHLSDLAYNTSLILVNSHFSINQARPTVPNLVEVGGLHIGQLQPLSKHFENLLNLTADRYKYSNGDYEGIIYLSMGSMLSAESLPSEKLAALLGTFRKLHYKVLWKGSRDDMPKDLDIPSNIKFEPWMPQIDILCHPHVKLFVSHGGLMGTQEAIFCGVPSLVLAIFADQEHNSKAWEAMGHAIVVDYDDITKKKIWSAVQALLENPKYTINAKRASKLFRDRPLSALETAIYWIEYVLRHDGAPHLRTVGADLPWYQYFLVDVIVAIYVVSLVLVVPAYLLGRYSVHLFILCY